MRPRHVVFLLWSSLLIGCDGGEDAGSPVETGSGGASGHGGSSAAGSSGAASAQPPPGGAIGWGDGAPGSVTLTTVHSPEKTGWLAPDLAFHPDRPGELWIVQRHASTELPCTEDKTSGCAALEGSVTIIEATGTADQKATFAKDPNAWHFMRRPPALAMGAGDTFATCGEARTGNFLDDPADFIGPTLWSSDPARFAVEPPGGNGSHLDMLHNTPFCMGIAHEQARIYWTLNGSIGSLDRYDFKADHGPGGSDHSDGEIYRYAEGEFVRVPDTPSHIFFNPEDGQVYVADSGNQRIARMDPSTATESGKVEPSYEPMAVMKRYTGAVVSDVVPKGMLERPSGVEIRDGLIYVTDAATSRFHVFDMSGATVRTLDTGLPAGTLSGFAFDEKGRIHFGDNLTGAVYRIDVVP
jgi:hypothetical protein